MDTFQLVWSTLIYFQDFLNEMTIIAHGENELFLIHGVRVFCKIPADKGVSDKPNTYASE